MFRLLCILVILAGAVHAQGTGRGRGGQAPKQTQEEKLLQQIRDLQKELRDLESRSLAGIVKPADLKRIFAAMAAINHPQAARTLAGYAEDPGYASVREEILGLLLTAPGADETLVSNVMRAHIGPEDPVRRTARKYLLDLAKRRGKDEWLDWFFAMGTTEDRFLAVQALGDIKSDAVLNHAATLLKDQSWRPDESGLVSCGTIAMSLRYVEGQPAARLLLLLALDSRFGTADAAKLREATRLWHQTDLRSYVHFVDLADRDPRTRADTATFLGAVGIESSRAPLLRVALNAREVPEVRAAAATALGGLRIAREDLVMQLKPLLSDPEPLVRRGAAEGLGRLKVKPAVGAFVSMLDGPYGEEIRKILERLTGKPADTDWRKFFELPQEPKPGK